jgi:hypothetical protein
MGNAGAIVAIAAAAKRRRRQEVVDAFRLGDATSPDRARRIDEIGVPHFGEAEELLTSGVLVPGLREGTFYLSEQAYIARRDRRTSLRKGVLVAMLAIIITVGIALLMRISQQ